MRKILLGSLFVFFLLPTVGGVINIQVSNKINENISIAIIFATGGLGDKSFNDAAYQGLVQANTTYTGQFNYKNVFPGSFDEYITLQQTLASEGHDLIICISWEQALSLSETALSYPNQRFTIIDPEPFLEAFVDRPNVSLITFKEQEGSYLVGAMAAMTTQTNKIGFFGGMNYWLINEWLAGYEQGAKLINDTIDISITYTPNATNPWTDVTNGQRVGKRLYNEGCDVIYAAAGASGYGVIQAASDFSNVYAIGADVDQDYLNPGKVLCSMMKRVDLAVFKVIEDIIFDTWAPDRTELGVAEGGVDISPMTYTESIKTGNFDFHGITQTRWQWISDIKQNITDGIISVSAIPSFPPYFPSVALLFTIGGKNDGYFNTAAYHGLQEVFDDYIGTFLYKYVEPTSFDEFGDLQQNLVNEGHDLIICVGFSHTSPLTITSNNFPDQRFTLIDDVVNKPNVASIIFKEQEGSYLVGAMAAMTTETNKVVFFGGINNHLINRFLAGYQGGLYYINQDISLTAAYTPDQDHPWTDFDGGKQVGADLYHQGNDIIYTAAGTVTGAGVMEAASERTQVYAIGVDVDQDGLYPGKVLCSMVKKYDTAVYRTIEDLLQRRWTGGVTELGLAEDGVDISPMKYTMGIRDGLYTKNSITKTRWEWISEIRQSIINETITVNYIPDWSSISIYKPPSTTTEPSTTERKTTTEKSTTMTSISPEISNWPGFMPIIVIFTIFFIRKKRKR
ncbi:MAG: BMP family protein [Promethearchaeota archaeon]